ncbi:MAG TPA: hypothetical protein VNA25_11170, partial [Phycisphaerae bacterium]|nr:hypothetical protein [Phycisphaerae bacterium]
MADVPPMTGGASVPSYYQEWYEPAPGEHQGSDVPLACMIWVPAGTGVLIALAIRQPVVGVVAVGLGTLLHMFIRPRIAIYVLIAIIGVQNLIGFIPEIFSAARAMGVIAGIISLPRILNSFSSPRKDPGAWFLVPFVVLGLITAMLSPVPAYSALLWITLASVYALPLLLGLWLDSEKRFRVGLTILVLATLVLAAFYTRGAGKEVVESWERVRVQTAIGEETRLDMNESARLMAVGFFTAIFLCVLSNGLWKKVLFLLAAFALFVGVVISKTRACYVALPLSVALGILLWRRGGVRKRVVVIGAGAITSIVLLLVVAEMGLLGAGIQDRLRSIF